MFTLTAISTNEVREVVWIFPQNNKDKHNSLLDELSGYDQSREVETSSIRDVRYKRPQTTKPSVS